MTDQTTQADKVIQALQSAKTRDVLAQRWAGMYRKARDYAENEDLTINNAFDAVLQEEEEPEHSINGDPPLASVTLQNKVIEEIGAPRVITHEELYDEFISILPREEGDWDIGDTDTHYDAYVIRIRSLLSSKNSRLISIASAWEKSTTHGGNTLPDDEQMDHEIWSEGGVRIVFTRVGPAEIDPAYHGSYCKLLYAQISGRMSPGALERMSIDVEDVTRSLVRSIAVLDQPGSFAYAARINELPPMDVDELDDNILFFQMCLGFCFGTDPPREDKPSRKKEARLRRRIQNAVTLLVSADKQERHSLGLALSVSAIEALVGEKSEKIAQSFADNLSTLLEPELEYRSRAVKELKTIYGRRSDALHGNETTKIDIEQWRSEARLLAAATFHAVFDYWRFSGNQFYESEKDEKTLQDVLREEKFSPGLPHGVNDQPAVWQLWRGNG